MPETTSVSPPAPHGATPSARQLAWHNMEYYGFIHFTVNTFTGLEWGEGGESPSIFNPSALDTRQWARAAADAGMKGLILTAKHHDGFCLWPSKYTEHSVKNSPWKNGKGDVVRDLREACDEFGLKMGLYLSPWDRNHAEYGRPAYIDYYMKQLDELLLGYGNLFEVWFDGANGGAGYYGGANETRKIDRTTYYNFPAIWQRVRELQPGAVIFSDAGPDVRWCGNERGEAPENCWAKINPEGIHVGNADRNRLAHGDPDGSVWRPTEIDTSIRKGWFYHDNQRPKSLDLLMDIYFQSAGRGGCLLLNIPPDKRGLFAEEDVARLKELRTALDTTFKTDLAAGKRASAQNVRGDSRAYAAANVTDGDSATCWATDDDCRESSLVVNLDETTTFNCARIDETIRLGQRVEEFAIDARIDGYWREIQRGTTIGGRRLLRFHDVRADEVRLRILKAQACPAISRLSVYRMPRV